MTQEQDKLEILQWLETNCCGYRRARTRENILPFVLNSHDFPTIESKDRYFRRVVAELKSTGHIFSSASLGYWFFPLVSNDACEIETALSSLVEEKAKAMDLLAGISNRERKLSDIKAKIFQGQKVMF